MARQARNTQSGEWFHVMNRGVNRRAVFLADTDRVDFVRLVGRACREHDVEVHAWCLMTNHFHLLMRGPTGSISAALGWVGTTYVRHLNDRIGRDGPLFRGRFRSVAVHDHAHLRWLGRYIHTNPPAATAGRLLDYRWSSLPDYLGRRRPPSWLHTDQLLGYHDHDRARFADFTLAEYVDLHLADDALDAVIELLADDHASAAGTPLRRAQATVRALALPSPASTVGERARQAAITRAEAAIRDDPALGDVVARVRRLAA